MITKKRSFSFVQNEDNSILSDLSETQKKKRKLSNDDIQIDCIQQNYSGDMIRGVVKQHLIFVFHVPAEIVQKIIEIILQYNKWNVWYKNGVNQKEWFKEIDEEIQHVYCANDYMFFQTSNKQIWCTGKNYFCQLGLNHNKSVDDIVLNDYFISKNIQIKKIWVSCFCPSGHTFWQDDANKIYGCGWNGAGQLGFARERLQIDTPEFIPSIQNVKQIATGIYHSIVLNQDGVVFANKFYETATIRNQGQNGDGNYNFSNSETNFNIIQCLKNKEIIQISVGLCHSLFLTANGIVYSCGDNTMSQLGYGNNDNRNFLYPTQIQFLVQRHIKIKQCASGCNHNLVLAESGDVYAFGSNVWGECGFNTNDTKINLPSKIVMNEEFQSIKCGNHHSYMKSKQQNHFLFGDNFYDQCSLKQADKTKIHKPLLINQIVKEIATHGFIEIKQICLGSDCTMIKTLGLQ